MLRKYKGNTYNGGERHNYLMARDTAEEDTVTGPNTLGVVFNALGILV
jgi:hypothetical protein